MKKLLVAIFAAILTVLIIRREIELKKEAADKMNKKALTV